MKPNITTFNILLFIISISIFIISNNKNNEQEKFNQQILKEISDYSDYKEALQESKMTQFNLIHFLKKHPNSAEVYHKNMLAQKNENLLIATTILNIISTNDINEYYEENKIVLQTLVDSYYSENIKDKKTDQLPTLQSEFKKQYLTHQK